MKISVFIILSIFIIMGVLLRFRKASFLISGYNTASKQEKEKYDEKALCKFVSNLLFVFSGIILLTAVAYALNLAYLKIIGDILVIPVAIAAVIYANTGNRFKKQ